MPQHPGFFISRYGCAFVSIALAIWMRLLLDPVLGIQFPFATVFLAVLVTAWYGGLRPALAAVVLGALASNFFLMPPRGRLGLTGLDQQMGMVLYIFTGLGISLLAGSMHAARQRAESAAESVQRQATLIDQTHDAVLVWDWNGPVTFWNRGAERLYGFSREEAMGRVSHNLLSANAPGGVATFIGALDREGIWEGELHHTSRGGLTIVVDSRMVLVRETGRAYVLETNRNITERKKAEGALRAANDRLEARVGDRTAELAQTNARLRASEERFRLLVEGVSSHAIFMLDPVGIVTSWNPGAERIKGYKAEEIIGQHFARFYTPEDIANGTPQRELQSAVAEGGFEEEALRVRKDGSRFWAVVTITPLYDDTPQPIGFVKITRDITERKRAEAALRDIEERLRFALQWSHTGGWDLDLFDHTAHRTLEHDRIFGYESLLPEWTYKMFLEHVLPEDRAEVDRLFHEAIAAQSDWSFECRIRRADGEVRWIWAAGGHRRDGEGPAQRMAGFVQDITERKKVEEALRASEERFRLLVEGVSDHAIFMLDPAGTILTWNSGAERIDGYAADEIIGQHYSCLFTPESITGGRPKEELELAAAEGKAAVEGWRLRKNGSRFWANGTLAALYDDHGTVQGFAKVTRDLTAKRRNDELLRSILDHAQDGIISIDERGTITMINRAGETIFGRPGSEVVGQNVNVLMPEPYRGEHDGYIEKYLRTGESKIIGMGREVQGLRKDGSTFPVELAVTEFQLDSHRNFVGIVRDMSEKKKLEAQLYQSQKMEAFGQLAGGVAHDFNNLLTVISGYSDMLLTALPRDDDTRRKVEAIRHAGQRAASLTRQLLAFSRQQVLEPKVLDLNGVVTDTEKMLRRLIGEDVHFATVLRPTISSVKVDPGQIEQVIMNLAVNARDAMPLGGKLTIETSEIELGESYTKAHPEARPGRFVMLAISDTGCGMSPDVRARMFEPFFTTKGVGKGTGLGLAVVHGIVKQSGGSIDVYSEVGVGTTFRVYLPAVQAQPANLADAGLEAAPGGAETILLVEDDDDVRGLAALVLQGLGYTVLTAPGSQAVLRLVASHRGKIDLLVTDVVMPEMSGCKLAQTLLAHYPGLKVLFLSGYTDDTVVRHGVLQTAVAFLQKPFTPNSLARKVRDVLDRQ